MAKRYHHKIRTHLEKHKHKYLFGLVSLKILLIILIGAHSYNFIQDNSAKAECFISKDNPDGCNPDVIRKTTSRQYDECTKKQMSCEYNIRIRNPGEICNGGVLGTSCKVPPIQECADGSCLKLDEKYSQLEKLNNLLMESYTELYEGLRTE